MVSIFSIIPAPFARVYAFPPAPPLFLSRGSPRTLPGAPPLDPVGGSAPPAVRKGRCASPPRRHLWVSGGMRWPAAHRERRARFVCRKLRRKRLVDGSIGRRKIPAPRGGGGRAQRAQSRGRGPLAPAPALVLWPGSPWAPRLQNAAAPAHPNAFPLPHAGAPPAALWRLPMGSRGMGRTRGCFPPTPKGSKKGGGQTALPIRCL